VRSDTAAAHNYNKRGPELREAFVGQEYAVSGELLEYEIYTMTAQLAIAKMGAL
jgi:hypothetical protein